MYLHQVLTFLSYHCYATSLQLAGMYDSKQGSSEIPSGTTCCKKAFDVKFPEYAHYLCSNDFLHKL